MKASAIFLFAVLTVCGYSQNNKDILSYVAQYKQTAIEEMVRTGIPASITMAQGILESGCGKSALSSMANNHFGIKCKTEWTGERYYQDDDEAQECFRVYEHAEASYVDHSDFLLTRYRYAGLFQLSPTEYKLWAFGLKEVGYATNPDYAGMLITYIENYNLHQLDLIALELIEENKKLLGLSESEGPAPVVAQAKPMPPRPSIQNTDTVLAEQKTTNRREYTVNGIRAVRAVANEDPLSVAFEYKIDYSYVVAYNDLANGEKFKNGEYIFLQPKKMKAQEASCIVLPGESMRDVSQRMGVKMKELYALNQMKMNEQVYPGEALHLREKRSAPPRTMTYADFLRVQSKIYTTTVVQYPETKTTAVSKSTPASAGNTSASQYKVQPSDTLYSIARKFNLTVEQLKDINKLSTTILKPGQVLLVSK